jgi:hypothetical protein
MVPIVLLCLVRMLGRLFARNNFCLEIFEVRVRLAGQVADDAAVVVVFVWLSHIEDDGIKRNSRDVSMT